MDVEKPRILSEMESLKFEVVSLNNQLLQLRKTLLDTQEALLMSQRDVLAMGEAKQMAERSNLLKAIGMDRKGKISFTKTPEGRYEASFEPGAEA